MQITCFIQIGFWVEYLESKYYKNHVGGNKI